MDIKELGKKYNLDNQKDVWNCQGNWIVTHDAVEKIMAIENIEVEKIEVLNSEWDFCRLLITVAKISKHDVAVKKITTIGEALLNKNDVIDITHKGKEVKRGNCQSQYIGAMAEKRGIDRAVLKLIGAYQYGVFSETEADSFARPTKKEPATDAQMNLLRQYEGMKILEYIGAEFGLTNLHELTKEQASQTISYLKGGK